MQTSECSFGNGAVLRKTILTQDPRCCADHFSTSPVCHEGDVTARRTGLMHSVFRLWARNWRSILQGIHSHHPSDRLIICFGPLKVPKNPKKKCQKVRYGLTSDSPTLFFASSVLMNADNGGVNHHPSQISGFNQRNETHLPDAIICPGFEAFVNCRPFAILRWQRATSSAVAPHPNHTLDKTSVVSAGTTRIALFARQCRRNTSRLIFS